MALQSEKSGVFPVFREFGGEAAVGGTVKPEHAALHKRTCNELDVFQGIERFGRQIGIAAVGHLSSEAPGRLEGACRSARLL